MRFVQKHLLIPSSPCITSHPILFSLIVPVPGDPPVYRLLCCSCAEYFSFSGPGDRREARDVTSRKNKLLKIVSLPLLIMCTASKHNIVFHAPLLSLFSSSSNACSLFPQTHREPESEHKPVIYDSHLVPFYGERLEIPGIVSLAEL